jgi:hypothetical protein
MQYILRYNEHNVMSYLCYICSQLDSYIKSSDESNEKFLTLPELNAGRPAGSPLYGTSYLGSKSKTNAYNITAVNEKLLNN